MGRIQTLKSLLRVLIYPLKEYSKWVLFQLRYGDAKIYPPIGYEVKDLKDIKIGKGATLVRVSKIGPGTVIGDFTAIDENCQLWSLKGSKITIGKFCAIASSSLLINHNHMIDVPSLNPSWFDLKLYNDMISSNTTSPIVVGNDVWIGYNSVILPGVTIGDGAVIGAGSVVTKDVEHYAIVAGAPARKIRDRFDRRIISELMEIRWWDWDIDRIKRNQKFFTTDLTKYGSSLHELIVD